MERFFAHCCRNWLTEGKQAMSVSPLWKAAIVVCVLCAAAIGDEFKAGDKLVVKGALAEIKAEPNSDGVTLDTLTRGKQVEVREVNGSWLAIRSPRRGWIEAASLTSPQSLIDNLTTEIEAKQDEVAALCCRGRVWGQLDEKEKSLADLNAAIRIDPRCALAFHYRGVAHSRADEDDQALVDLDRAIALDAQSAHAFTTRAAVWFSKDESQKAIADADAALKLDPGFVDAHALMGIAHLSQGDTKRAIHHLDRAVAAVPDEAVYRMARGAAYVQADNHDSALDDFNEAIHLDANNVQAYEIRAYIWQKKEDWVRAIADYNEIISASPRPTSTSNVAKRGSEIVKPIAPSTIFPRQLKPNRRTPTTSSIEPMFGMPKTTQTRRSATTPKR